MNLGKIGMFISTCRKKRNITQAELAEKLGITDRAVSKWETGKSLPDASIMLDLCEILQINVNDLLNGEVVTMSENNQKHEQTILKLLKEKQEADKRLLMVEIFIGILATVSLLGAVFLSAFVNMETWLKVVLIIFGAIIFFCGCFIALRIEQVAGYYECSNCNYKYVPTYKSVVMAMHFGRTRFLKCPNCGRKSWQKKVNDQ